MPEMPLPLEDSVSGAMPAAIAYQDKIKLKPHRKRQRINIKRPEGGDLVMPAPGSPGDPGDLMFGGAELADQPESPAPAAAPAPGTGAEPSDGQDKA